MVPICGGLNDSLPHDFPSASITHTNYILNSNLFTRKRGWTCSGFWKCYVDIVYFTNSARRGPYTEEEENAEKK